MKTSGTVLSLRLAANGSDVLDLTEQTVTAEDRSEKRLDFCDIVASLDVNVDRGRLVFVDGTRGVQTHRR